MRIGYLLYNGGTDIDQLRRHMMQKLNCQAVFVDPGPHTRRQLSMALTSMVSHDTLVIESIKQSGFSAFQFLSLLEQIDRRGATLEVASPMLSSSQPEGQQLLLDLLIRQLRSERPGNSRHLSKRRGRRPKLDADAMRQIAERLRAGLNTRDIARHMDVSIATLYRYKRLIEDNNEV
ncbi:helix-turn-helix domain-containing protein [Silvimonas iriomotensis]|uniref:DNA-invertase n=1 Tax=Silvimonas iriomotensis TaxID=449662 RepID=A0ABQ2P9P5_9NEIS|nr:helix-turn-helix domain-containing protein [Silvimonas iriomotensis]GGP21485.1 DNA-invertase [Silvimonas iriomotensis]